VDSGLIFQMLEEESQGTLVRPPLSPYWQNVAT